MNKSQGNIFLKFTTLFAIFVTVVACAPKPKPYIPDVEEVVTANSQVIFPEDPNLVRTPDGANALDLENPLRCYVNWNTQEMITTLPYNITSFNLVRNGRNDILPRFEVTGFSFKSMPAEKAILKLTKEAKITLVAKDGPYASISAENLRGEFSDVLKMITDAAEIYYAYDDEKKVITLSRKANFTLYVPKSRPIMLGLLDVLRGAGITSSTTNWSDFSLNFDADVELKNKIMELIEYFEKNPILIAFDVTVLRIYPYNPNENVEWDKMLDFFDLSTISTMKTGIIGRVATTSNEINVSSLRQFLGQQAMVMPVTEGKFVVPSSWFSRFDVGKCAKRDAIEAGMSILAKANMEHANKLFSDITFEVSEGQITQFQVRSTLGENLVVFGIPNEIFGVTSPKSETVVFMVPRIIRTINTTTQVK